MLCLIIACSGAAGLWHNIKVPVDAVDSSITINDNSIVGIVLTTWNYVTQSECAAACEACEWVLNAEIDRCRTQNHRGFLLYPVEGVARFAHAIQCPAVATNRE